LLQCNLYITKNHHN